MTDCCHLVRLHCFADSQVIKLAGDLASFVMTQITLLSQTVKNAGVCVECLIGSMKLRLYSLFVKFTSWTVSSLAS